MALRHSRMVRGESGRHHGKPRSDTLLGLAGDRSGWREFRRFRRGRLVSGEGYAPAALMPNLAARAHRLRKLSARTPHRATHKPLADCV